MIQRVSYFLASLVGTISLGKDTGHILKGKEGGQEIVASAKEGFFSRLSFCVPGVALCFFALGDC